MGVRVKIERFPSPNSSALRKWLSAIGPKIRPKTTGDTGIVKR